MILGSQNRPSTIFETILKFTQMACPCCGIECEGAGEHERGGEEEGGEGRPAPAQHVQDVDAEEVGGQLECGGNGEGDVDAVVDVGDVADVAVEEEPRHHPGTSNDSQRRAS